MNKVLVTGADGFIGSHLTEMLLQKGYKVRALAQYNSFNYWGWLEEICPKKHLEIISGDIRDTRFCIELVKGVDLVFHLAALIAIPYSYIAPDSYVQTNINGTHNICQAIKETGHIRFIHTSTSEVYGTAKYVPIDEKHPKQPQSPYSASKIAADMMVMSYYHSYNLPITIARPFNTYGPRQSARAIIPSIIIQIANGSNEINLGDLTPTRDFNYVKDICYGLIALAEKDVTIGKEINISSNSETSVYDLLKLIQKIMNSDLDYITDEQRLRPKKSEVYQLLGDNSLIKNLTDFKPMYSLEKGLEETVIWFTNKRNLSKYKSEIYNV